MLRTIKNVWKWKKNELKHAEKKTTSIVPN